MSDMSGRPVIRLFQTQMEDHLPAHGIKQKKIKKRKRKNKKKKKEKKKDHPAIGHVSIAKIQNYERQRE